MRPSRILTLQSTWRAFPSKGGRKRRGRVVFGCSPSYYHTRCITLANELYPGIHSPWSPNRLTSCARVFVSARGAVCFRKDSGGSSDSSDSDTDDSSDEGSSSRRRRRKKEKSKKSKKKEDKVELPYK